MLVALVSIRRSLIAKLGAKFRVKTLVLNDKAYFMRLLDLGGSMDE